MSVVTPFYNTAPYLAQCIESVLAQTYSNFEYILADNCSTDGSAEIAEKYARRDSRIRFIRYSELIPQVPNYNRALLQISPASKYCKIVQADDWIYPDCLKLMVEKFEQSESIGLVSSYDMKGDMVRGLGFPEIYSQASGREVAKYYLRGGIYVFGSPTTVMYRSSLIRDAKHFFSEGLLHEDTEKCMEILQNWDFGFVYQVLSALRVGNESISSSAITLQAGSLDHYIILQRFSKIFLPAGEAASVVEKSTEDYYQVLASQAIRFRGPAFWRYHRSGIKSLNERLSIPRLSLAILKELFNMLANPGNTLTRIRAATNRKVSGKIRPST